MLFFTSCNQGKEEHNEDSKGIHTQAEGESHNHSEDDGHDHSKGESNHTDEISFTKAQAEAVGLIVETVSPGAFQQVIKTS